MTNILYGLTSIPDIITKMSLVLFQTKKETPKPDWVYRGEGNANIVISLPEKRQILRIRKTERPDTFFVWLVEWLGGLVDWDCKLEVKNECQDLSFYRSVMMPLLGKYVCEPTPVFVSRKQTNDLTKAISQSRPNFRKHKKLQFGRATFFTDYAFLPKSLDSYKLVGATYSVEIKPKQGWVPVQSRQYSKCQFCQNQYLKLKQGQIKKISGYCPLDLFSGCKERMIKAIKSLIYNPQNNFKIFRNGNQIYGQNISVENFYDLIREWLQNDGELSTYSLLEEFCELIYNILVKQIDKSYTDHICILQTTQRANTVTDSYEADKTRCIFSDSNLPKGCVLERILSIQKFDQVGLDQYAELQKRCFSEKTNDYTYVESLVKEVYKVKCPHCVIASHIKENGDISELELMPYLIASVVNDCSLMITCRRIRDSDSFNLEEHMVETKTRNFVVNVGVFDLYPKPMSTIQKHIKRKMKIQKACEYS